jgi:hypothetical protein
MEIIPEMRQKVILPPEVEEYIKENYTKLSRPQIAENIVKFFGYEITGTQVFKYLQKNGMTRQGQVASHVPEVKNITWCGEKMRLATSVVKLHLGGASMDLWIVHLLDAPYYVRTARARESAVNQLKKDYKAFRELKIGEATKGGDKIREIRLDP